MASIHWQLLQAVALGSLVAWASGLRLYLVVFVLGLSARLGYLTLPEGLAILSHSVIAAAGFLLAIEFLADKIPGIDSAWDAVHTFIRIPAGRSGRGRGTTHEASGRRSVSESAWISAALDQGLAPGYRRRRALARLPPGVPARSATPRVPCRRASPKCNGPSPRPRP